MIKSIVGERMCFDKQHVARAAGGKRMNTGEGMRSVEQGVIIVQAQTKTHRVRLRAYADVRKERRVGV